MCFSLWFVSFNINNISEPPYVLANLKNFSFAILHICLYICEEFEFMSMLYTEWANRILVWLSENLYSMYIFTRTTAKLIQRLCIYIQQSLMRYHDFAVLWPGFNTPTCIFGFFLHIIASSMACTKVLFSLHNYTIDPLTIYNNIINNGYKLTGIVPGNGKFMF